MPFPLSIPSLINFQLIDIAKVNDKSKTLLVYLHRLFTGVYVTSAEKMDMQTQTQTQTQTHTLILLLVVLPKREQIGWQLKVETKRNSKAALNLPSP